MRLSIVMPVYNEGEVIEKTIQGIETKVKIPHELLIIYDMDHDTTIKPTRQLKKKYSNVNLIKNIYGRGALNALKTGLKKAKGEAVCIMMADLTDDPVILNKMYRMYGKGFDVVAASRYMRGGKQIGGPILKQILSRMAGVSLHYLVGLPTYDATNSFRLYSKKFLDSVKIEADGGFELAIELTVKAHFGGFKVTEVPTTWTFLAKESRFYLAKWLPKYLKWYFWAVNKRVRQIPQSS